MINHFLVITLSNISSLIFGFIFGIVVPSIIILFIFSSKIKKNTKNDKIYNIALDNYNVNFKDKINIKEGLIKEVNDISKLVYPDKEKPFYELSINDVFFAIDITTIKLNRIINNPAMKYMKNIHISTLLNLKTSFYDPINKVFKNKFLKSLYFCYKVLMVFINLFNPLFYIRKIANRILIKKGKKEIIIYSLNELGETIFDTYTNT